MATSKKAGPKRTKPRAGGPSEIAPGVSVGGWKDALQFEGSRFCVLDEAPDDMPSGTHIPIYDDRTGRAITENLDRLAREMAKEHSAGHPVLVFCGHGVRRSPLAGAWYLHRIEGLSLDQAYERIRSVRPRIEEAKEWVGSTDGLESP